MQSEWWRCLKLRTFSVIPKKENQCVTIHQSMDALYYKMFIIPEPYLMIVVLTWMILQIRNKLQWTIFDINRRDYCLCRGDPSELIKLLRHWSLMRIKCQCYTWEVRCVQTDLSQKCQFANEFIWMIMMGSYRRCFRIQQGGIQSHFYRKFVYILGMRPIHRCLENIDVFLIDNIV